MTLHLLGLCSSVEAAQECSERLAGRLWVARDGERDEPWFRAMCEVVTEDRQAVAAVADLGLYVGFRRIVKPLSAPAPTERVVASFAMVRRADLTHRAADDHWRDRHGPVALRCHRAMCDYEQLSIVATLSGTELDGVALCAFASRDDLRHRFFNDDRARREVIADVATFADTQRSLPRVVLTQVR